MLLTLSLPRLIAMRLTSSTSLGVHDRIPIIAWLRAHMHLIEQQMSIILRF